MASERELNRDITLPPDTYLYLVNEGKGGILTVHRGPTVVNQTGQDQPVKYDPMNRTYKGCKLEEAMMTCPRANEGDYVVLENPNEGDKLKFPSENTQQATKLTKGRKVIIPGPWSEPLWPGQSATIIEGHRLRSNQYVVAIVYNAEEAEKNWESTVAVTQTEGEGEGGEEGEGTKVKTEHKKGLTKPDSFAVGTRIVIKGSEVSFYIPCTGVEVMKDKDSKYVREAVTLEQLEYCCLVDESGKKEYPRGPKVVFPKPTQVFEEDKKSRRKFRPIELNNINGIHLKVTADFEGPEIEKDTSKQRKFEEGEELFVTGNTLSIYYPREELSVIEYGQGNKKHYSTAVPKGEGRYLINRSTGEIKLVRGPRMLLPDPRSEILVRRILSDDECILWYPGPDAKGNPAVLAYNRDLAQAMAESPSGRSGVVSEGDYRKRQAQMLGGAKGAGGSRNFIGGGLEATHALAASAFDSADDYSAEEVGAEGGATGTIGRGTRYTTPRQLTLNTKFDGVPRVEIYPGYAVLIVGSEGGRRVVKGPEVVLLEYDEKLGFMKLSTGKPKSTDSYFRTSYLCVDNNQVGDIVAFESKDHVKGNIKLSLRVNFEGDTQDEMLRWFSTDNYVKFLCDHVRSIIAGVTKKLTVAELKADYVNLVREAILGKKTQDNASESLRTSRPGLHFENGMRVVEVEVLDLTLADTKIAQMLDQAQHKVVSTNIEIDAARKDLEAARVKEEIEQAKARVTHDTTSLKRTLQKEAIEGEVVILLAQVEMELRKLEGEKQKVDAKEDITDLAEERKLVRAKKETDHLNAVDTAKLTLKERELNATTSAAVARFNAAKEGLYEVLVSLGRDEMAAKLAEACTIESWLSGDNIGNSISNLLSIAPTLKGFFDKAAAIQGTDGNGSGRGKNRLKAPAETVTK